MSILFHQFRTRSRGLIHGLTLLLVATWLSLACPNCFAAAEAGVPDLPCHQQSAAPAQSAAHDCCQQGDHKLPCDDPGCAEPVAITDAGKAATNGLDQLAAVLLTSRPAFVHPAAQAPPAPLPHAHAIVSACPVYLRHCAFLN